MFVCKQHLYDRREGMVGGREPPVIGIFERPCGEARIHLSLSLAEKLIGVLGQPLRLA